MFFLIFITAYFFLLRLVVYKKVTLVDFSPVNRKIENCYVFFSFGLLFLLTALRGENVGNDTESYRALYEFYSGQSAVQYTNEALVWMTQSIEVGWRALNYILIRLGLGYQVLIVLVAAFAYRYTIKFFRRYSDNLFLISLLFFFLCYRYYVNTLRQLIAITIILMAFPILVEGKNLKFGIFVIIASLFHSSAIIMLGLIMLRKMRFTRGRQLILLAVSGICGFMHMPRRVLEIVGYTTKYTRIKVGVSNIYTLIIVFMLLIFFSDVDAAHSYNETEDLEDMCIDHILRWVPTIMGCLTLLMMDISYISRFLYYFYPLYLIGFTRRLHSSTSINRKIIPSVMVTVTFVYVFGISIFRPDWVTEFNYSFFWQ